MMMVPINDVRVDSPIPMTSAAAEAINKERLAPVVMLTAFAQPEFVARAVEAGTALPIEAAVREAATCQAASKKASPSLEISPRRLPGSTAVRVGRCVMKVRP